MRITENALNVMAVLGFKGIRNAWVNKHLSTRKTVSEIVELLNNSVASLSVSVDEFNRRKKAVKEALSQLSVYVDGVVAIGDDDFPPCRGIVKDSEKPVFLLYRGDLSLLAADSKNVAVIGLLNPIQEIERIEREVVARLVEGGAVIVSGLARGCDTIAHKQTLDSGGRTVAILPSPLNNILPEQNRALATEIVKHGGLLISEYFTSPKSRMELRGRYIERDRLQALYSNVVVLIASYSKDDIGCDSGSRFAMEYAKKYSIPRAVLYDDKPCSNDQYNLNRQIISQDTSVYIVRWDNISSSVNDVLSLRPSVHSKLLQYSLIQ